MLKHKRVLEYIKIRKYVSILLYLSQIVINYKNQCIKSSYSNIIIDV